MRYFFFLLSVLAVLVVPYGAGPAQAQSSTPPRLVFQASIPGLNLSKFPDVAAFDRTVHIGVNNNRTDTVYLFKGDTAQNFSPIEDIGDAPGQADFSPVSIATGFDGSVHVAWINQQNRRLLYRSKPANGTWGPERLIVTARGFPANLTLNVATDGAIFVAWREADAPSRVVRSTNGGVNWSSQFTLGSNPGINFPFVATGPGGRVSVVYTSPASGRLQIFAAIWNGNGFDIQRVSPLDGDYADPSATYDAEGNLVVAWRGTEESPISGVWLGTQSGSGFQVNRLTDRINVNDLVNVQSDAQGNLHLVWIAQVGREQRIFYSFRPRGGAFGNPISAPNPGGSIFNARMSANIGDEAYAHVVSEFFQGDGTTTSVRYYLFAATSAPPVGGQPDIEDGERISEREQAVRVTFSNIQGQPTQIRWRWGAAPDDANSDSNGWTTFSNTMDIPVPQRVYDGPVCQPVRLFTQLREADNDTGAAQSDDIIFDVGITAFVGASNPYSRKAPIFTSPALADTGVNAASDGDLAYTRDPIYYVELRGNNECSGLKDVAMGRSTTSITRAMTVTNEVFANVLGYPGAMSPGPNQFIVRVSDRAGNVADFQQTLVYDPQKPVLNATTPGSVTATSDPNATIVLRLAFSNVAVTDNLYPERGFWGVWVTASRTPVENPTVATNLSWTPIVAPGTSNSFTIDNWSLAGAIERAELTPGTYNIYVRFLDGAGNPTDGFLTTTVSLTTVTQPRVALPLVTRR